MNTISASLSGGDSSFHPARWGKPLTAISAFALVMCLGLPLYLTTIIKLPQHGMELFLGTVVAPILVPLAALPFVVRGYTLTRHNLRIHRLWWDTVIPRKTIKAARLQPHVMGRSIRTFGNGGLFSFTGRYWNKALGHYKAYVTDFNTTVVVQTNQGVVVISPEDPETFLRDLNLA